MIWYSPIEEQVWIRHRSRRYLGQERRIQMMIVVVGGEIWQQTQSLGPILNIPVPNFVEFDVFVQDDLFELARIVQQLFFLQESTMEYLAHTGLGKATLAGATHNWSISS